AARVRARTAVRRDLVVLDALGGADDRGIARVGCRRFSHAIVCFLNDAVEPGTASRPNFLAPMGEDQLQALEMEPRLLAVAYERFLQFRRAGGLGKPRQRANHLSF